MTLIPLTPSDPHRLGSYWLAGRLGAGGQGVVYEAYGETGERVAIKVPRLDDPASRTRLAKEAAAAQRVASFCTARVIETRTDIAEPYIVSEYVPGLNLRQVIGKAGPYEGDALRRLAIGVATALTAIHQVGVVHRDLKPDNIILGPDGPRVIDFGVAKELGLPGTMTGPVMGTPNYMAPEVFAGRGAEASADMWAWGLVVLFAALGEDAVPGQEPLAVVNLVLNFRPDLGMLPEPLDRLVDGAISRDPGARPSARAVLLDLLGGHDSDRLLAKGGSAAAEVRAPLTTRPDLGTIAEELYEELSEGEQTAAPEVFLRMVSATEDSDETIRRVPRDELEESEAVASLLTVYGAAGLIVEIDSTYTLAHPALIRAWPRLREWVAENREGLPIHRRLTEAARFWDGNGRKPGDLLHGSTFDRAFRWAAVERRNITLIRLEREFLDRASTQSRRQSRRRGLLAAALSILLVAALGGLGLAEYRRAEANRQRDDAAARSLVVRARDLRETTPRAAMLMSVAAWRLGPALPETRGALYDSLSQSTTDSSTDPDVTLDTEYATSQDGRTLVSVRLGQVTLWDVRAHRKLRAFSGVSQTVVAAALNPDGRTLALQDDHDVRLWDTVTGTAVGSGFAGPGQPKQVAPLRFDPTGRMLSIPEQNASYGTARWWDLKERRKIGPGVDAVNADASLGVMFSAGRGKAELWDLRSGKRIQAGWLPEKKKIKNAEFSHDGRALALTVIVGVERGLGLLLRRVPSGAALKGDGGGPVGSNLAFGFGDRFLALWDTTQLTVLRLVDGREVIRRDLHASIGDLRFDEADRVLRIDAGAGTVFTVDMASLLDRPSLPGSAHNGKAHLSPGGEVLAFYTPGEVRLWDVPGARPLGQPAKLDNPEWEYPSLAFSGDGRQLAIGGSVRLEGELRAGVIIVDAATGRMTRSHTVSNREAQTVAGLAFSPDGGTLAITPERQGIYSPLVLWDMAGAEDRTVDDVTGSAGLAYRPDGKLLVAGFQSELALVDPVKATRLTRPGGSGSLAAGPYAFSPDGKQVVIGSDTGRLSLWDSGFGGPVGRPFLDSAAQVTSLAWSPDGRMIASYERGDRIRLWDVNTQQALGIVFDGQTETGFAGTASLAFSKDGRTLHSAAPDGVLRAHVLDGDRAAAAVCRRAGESLSAEEWRRYIPEVARFDLCGPP